MLTTMLGTLRQEYRTHRMARFAVWIVAYGAALWVVKRFTGGLPGLLWFLFWVTFIPSSVYVLFRLIGFVRQRVLWRLRRRLIVTYLFIAVVPIVLILILVVVGAFIINGQFASFLVALRLREHADELQQMNRVLTHQARLIPHPTPAALLDHLQKFFLTELAEHAPSYTGLEITLRAGPLARAFRLDGKPLAKPVAVPVWFKREEFAGIVWDQGQIALRAAENSRTSVGDLTVILSQPFTPQLLDQVGRGIGPLGILSPQGEKPASDARAPEPSPNLRLTQGRPVQAVTVRSKSVILPEPINRLDFTVRGASLLDPTLWNEKQERHDSGTGLVFVTSRIATLNRQLLATLGQLSQVYVILFIVVAVIFLVIELFALLIAVQLTRSMTTTVDKLYKATEQVKTGDFSHRISLPARDQLSALGEAFDGMTASVERLLRESQEKSRLESELEIAREVQSQLFPQAVPEVPGLRLYGVCKPARVVSGDYYDFLRLCENRVGLVLGDISGKGISAALLMAAIQSALHAQFYDGLSAGGTASALSASAAEVVARLNRQLFESTPPEKYATFFYALYDAGLRKLTYTNAGHPPPALFRRSKIERLETGGTVVGLFSPMKYEQAVVELEPGDLLLAFTDGLTEPENSYGEEFGEARLLDVARHALSSPPEVLVEEIYRRVSDWTGRPELQDDMTLLVMKAIS